jgi:hypothetical protein
MERAWMRREEMDKDKLIFLLNSTVRQISFLKESDLEKEKTADGYRMKFRRFNFAEVPKPELDLTLRHPKTTGVDVEIIIREFEVPLDGESLDDQGRIKKDFT